MKAVNGRVVGINKTSKDIEGTVRLTKDTNMAQLITGNNVIIYVDSSISEEMMFKAGVTMNVFGAESAVFRCADWGFQLLMQPIS